MNPGGYLTNHLLDPSGGGLAQQGYLFGPVSGVPLQGLPPQHIQPGPLMDPLAAFHLGPSRSAAPDPQHKQQICFDFCKGNCRRGSSCKYLHNPDMNAMMAFQQGALSNHAGPGSRSSGSNKSQSVCYDFVRGACRRGVECKYSHDPQTIAQAAATRMQSPAEICLDFSRGRCVRGALCRYSHDLRVIQAASLSRFIEAAKQNPLGSGGPSQPNSAGGLPSDVSPTALAAAAAGLDLDNLTEHVRRLLEHKDGGNNNRSPTPSSATGLSNGGGNGGLGSSTVSAPASLQSEIVKAILDRLGMPSGARTAPPRVDTQAQAASPLAPGSAGGARHESATAGSSLGAAMDIAALAAGMQQQAVPGPQVDARELARVMENISQIQASMAALAGGAAAAAAAASSAAALPPSLAPVATKPPLSPVSSSGSEVELPLTVAVPRPSSGQARLQLAAAPAPTAAPPPPQEDEEVDPEEMERELLAALAKVKRLKELRSGDSKSGTPVSASAANGGLDA